MRKSMEEESDLVSLVSSRVQEERALKAKAGEEFQHESAQAVDSML